MPAYKLVKVFYCCSNAVKDEQLRQKLETHLTVLKRRRVITDWHQGMVSPGKEWEIESDRELNEADIILVLISSDFIASNYNWEVVIKKAMQRHRAGEARVIPILLRPVLDDWKLALDNLPALPKGERPITDWKPHDNAFHNIAQGIKEVVDELTDPTFPIKQYSRQTGAVVMPVIKAAGNALLHIVRQTLLYVFKSSKTRRHRRASKILDKTVILIIVCSISILLFFWQTGIHRSFLLESSSNLELTEKVNSSGWIWLGIVKNFPGSLSPGKPLVIQQKNIEDYPSIYPLVVPSPGEVVTVQRIVHLRKEKSLDTEIINEFIPDQKLVILKVEPLTKPSRNSPYVQLMAKVRKCYNCNKK
ncbi:MAG TPA: toll/interleukin-1 receptor domain-containing protein [Trichormus sp. M33_DOE_039]|nr:toll/interleukin-1 receptor domain-containing protein [Trichormus sp. M33_DOE_039]